MIRLEPFGSEDFNTLISWIDSRELLITIAGKDFSYPLNSAQLQHYLDDENSQPFSIMDVSSATLVGHVEIRLSGVGTYKIDKLIIGETSNRGKGIGQQVIHELLTHCFTVLGANIVELNVFDWNKGGIRCYEKCGFRFNPDKKSTFQFDDRTWTALNMMIDRPEWVNRNTAGKDR